MTTEGTYPHADGRRQLVVRPSDRRAAGVRLADPPDHGGRPQPCSDLRAAAPRGARRARSNCGRSSCHGAAGWFAPTTRAREPARQPGAVPDRLGGKLRRSARRARVVQAQARRRAPRVPRSRRLGSAFSARSRTCSPKVIRTPGRRPQLDAVEAARLYQTIYWIARAAGVPTPRDRPAARHRRRLGGHPGARAQAAARHRHAAHRARRVRARGLPRGGAQPLLAGRAVPQQPPGAGAEPRGLRSRGLRLARHRGERRLGARAGRRPGEDPRDPERHRGSDELHRSRRAT